MDGRVHRFSDALRRRFPFRVRKLPIDAGFTCPNRDGTKAWGGCTYCDNRSFSPPARDRSVDVREQVRRGLRGPDDRAIAYFQAYTNTYADLAFLRAAYDAALGDPRVVGLAIATRPDCLPDATLDLVDEYARRLPVWLEVGLESSHDATLASVNRAHTYADFEDAVRRASGRAFELVVHLIFGLPGETRADMLLTVDRVAALPVNAVKLHHFYVAKATPLEAAWRRGEIRVMDADDWVALAADVIERLPETLYVERVAGELGNDWLVAPRWGLSGGAMWGAIESELARRGTRQGARAAVGGRCHGAVSEV